jgi:hypothetical protein
VSALGLTSLLLWASLTGRILWNPARSAKGLHPLLAVLSSIVLAAWAASQ